MGAVKTQILLAKTILPMQSPWPLMLNDSTMNIVLQ